MSLRNKLFLSYLVVIAALLLLMAAATALIAPAAFSGHVMMMPGRGHHADETSVSGEDSPGNGMMSGRGTGVMEEFMLDYGDELAEGFRASVGEALLVAGLAALVVAAGASWYVGGLILRPLHEVGRASQVIAAGHYAERLAVYGNDELADLTRSFNQMAASLDAIESMRRTLIADVSHELKTPLASIKGYMEGLQDGVLSPSPEIFQIIHREADRLQRLVFDLQELSRAEADQLQLQIAPQDALALATAAADWLRPQFEDRGIALMLDLPPQAVQVRADFDRVRQVLLNLLGNALQYTPEGGQVTLRVRPEHVRSEKDSVRFAVQDTGEGLAAADLERVFQRFYRVDRSRSRASGGSGIGLTIARHIIDAHGGRIWAESAGPGQGCTFVFTLPAG